MSEFTSDGHEPVPGIYSTEREIENLSTLDGSKLVLMAEDVNSMLEQQVLNPRASSVAQRIINHLSFEQRYREGFYDEVIARTRAKEGASSETTPEDTPPGLVSRAKQN